MTDTYMRESVRVFQMMQVSGIRHHLQMMNINSFNSEDSFLKLPLKKQRELTTLREVKNEGSNDPFSQHSHFALTHKKYFHLVPSHRLIDKK